MVNAWASKKPLKYWRAFTPRDIPLENDKPILYYEWNNLVHKWECSLLAPINRNWSHSNIQKMISIHNRLIQGGIQETVIVEVHPKFRIGKYKNNIEILQIYSENTQFDRTNYTYKIYETEYYVKYNNRVDILTETTLHEMIKFNKNLFTYEYKLTPSTTLYIRNKTNKPKRDKKQIEHILSSPYLILKIPNDNPIELVSENTRHTLSSPYFILKRPNDNPLELIGKNTQSSWKYVKTFNMSNERWHKLSEESDPHLYNVDGILAIHITFTNFKKYCEGQIKAVQTKSTKTASFHRRGAGSTHKNPIEKPQVKNSVKREKPEFVYVLYKNPQQKTIAKKCLKVYAEKLQEKHPEVKILTVSDIKSKYPAAGKNNSQILHPEGMFNRRARRLTKQKNRKYNRNVKIQRIYVQINDVEKHQPIANKPWLNKNGHENKPIFINHNNINGSVIKVNGKLVQKDSEKLIYHDTNFVKKPSITRHNATKRSINPTLEELRKKYLSHDRRYTSNSDVENWSIQFFIALKMIKEKERRKKVVKYLKDTCGLSEEFINGFIQYLHLTKNGDPTREHKRNQPIRYKRIMVTKPHLSLNTPDLRQALIIEHEVKDEENNGVKNIITENVLVRYNKKEGMQFFSYNKETNEHILISKARDVKKWAYVQEYNADPKTTKWHELVSVETKQVPEIVKIPFTLERTVVGSNIKKWKAPISEEKTVRYIIKKLNVLYKTEKYELLYSLIYNTIMEYYRNNDSLYNAIRFALYHNYSDLSKKLVTLIKVNKMDDPDLVIFMEDLLHPH